jgi:hypothetical protein
MKMLGTLISSLHIVDIIELAHCAHTYQNKKSGKRNLKGHNDED